MTKEEFLKNEKARFSQMTEEEKEEHKKYVEEIKHKRSNETYKLAVTMLRQHNKCAIIRPTGFGKTYTMCKISKLYNRVLYIYPSDIIRENAKEMFAFFDLQDGMESNVDYITYSMVGRMGKTDGVLENHLSNGDYDLIIFDELHNMGARLVKKALDNVTKLIDSNKVHMIGASATPNRMDKFDPISVYFEGHVIKDYTINNMLKDKLIPPIYYCYATIGTEVIVNGIDEAEENTKLTYTETNTKLWLRDKKSQLSKTINAPEIIKDAINTVYDEVPSYMRFIVFFSRIDVLEAKALEVEQWFKRAFPKYRVNKPLKIYSDVNYSKNISKLASLSKKNKTIDLIYSIDMLNEGYHTDDLTGCIMLRPTRSATVLTQQAGRCFRIGMLENPIIIDFVKNYETPSIFRFNGDDGSVESKLTKEQQKQRKQAEEDSGLVSFIDPEYMVLDNKVAEQKKVIERITESCKYRTLVDDVLFTRIKYKVTATQIQQILGMRRCKVGLEEIITILLENRSELAKMKLAFDIEVDKYKTGDPKNREINEEVVEIWEKLKDVNIKETEYELVEKTKELLEEDRKEFERVKERKHKELGIA